MDNNRLQLLFNVVHKALSMQPHERMRYVQDACGNDTALKTEVYEMLKSIDDSESFWEDWREWNEHRMKNIFKDSGSDDREYSGEMIGPWRLLKQLGEGGMGVVYLAERADGSFRQQVALKLLRQVYTHRELQSRSIQRFQQERQILARLSHPNIARLYDGGYTEDGLPWLAMEYVDGIPITEWSRRQNCSLEERLQLFKNICEAIRYAHRNLIVHRDLKPENILVTHDGQVKILDFGIAKLLTDELPTPQQVLTQTGLRALSLIHAAPEQITGEPITTATDVYALGLLLYQLVAGVYPFALEGLTVRQIEQVIRNDEPVRPSSVYKRSTTVLDSRVIRGDLDAIIMKALRKEPNQRYENAGHMLDDIIRYRKNLPVMARRDTFQYRVGKFIKRHRRAMVTGIIIVIGIIGMTAYHTWQLADERDIAKREAVRTEQVSTFLADMFIASDPSESRGENLTARDLLDRGAERIHEFSDQPEVQATMMQLIGHVYWSLGLYEEALPLLERAVGLWQMIDHNPTPERARAHYTLGIVLHDMGDYRRAVPHFEEAVGIFRSDPNHISPEYASSLENMGYVEDARRNYKASEELHREALDVRLSLFGPDHPDVASSHHSIGIARFHQGDLEGAIAGQREAVRIFRVNEMIDTRLGARALRQLGTTLIEKEEFNEAEEILMEVLYINRRIHGEKHLDTGLAVRTLATLNHKRENYEAAEQLYEEALAIMRLALGDRHVMVGQVLQELGDLYTQTHNHFQAEHVYRESLEIFETAARVHPQRIVKSRRMLGSTLVILGRYEEAEGLLLESLAIATTMAAENDDNGQFVTRSLEELVLLYNEWGRIEQSERYRELLADSLVK
jgi:eukaryotic-like serine/threonine-protein kinase